MQTSIRPYADDESKVVSEAKPVHFLIGNNDSVKETINGIIESGGVVLTRAWAKAFTYIRGIDSNQVKLLEDIYNSYYRSPIDIRVEITEMGNVTWVRAFKFIFSFHKAYTTGSFIDALKAFNLYIDVDRRKLNINLLRQIKLLSDEVFSGLTDATATVAIIETLKTKINDSRYSSLIANFLGGDFGISVFDEYDLTSKSREKFVNALKQLTWVTSYKLFSEVFSKDSNYMTVHQAKGLEWDKVIVSVEPNRFDKTKICEVYSNPQILEETSAEEFVRMYYVASSRAKEDLYIHLPDDFDTSLITNLFKKPNAYEIQQ
jgi:hypothetical protein